MSCTFCGRVAVLEPVRGMRVCQTCRNAVGNLAAHPDHALGVWNDTATVPASAAPRTEETFDANRVFEDFKAGVARQISAEDSRSHLHLAEAYAEMALLVDARREAGVAATGAIPEVAQDALRLLLTPPLLADEGIARLRSLLSRNTLN